MSVYRRQAAFDARVSAAQNAKDRDHPQHQANGDEQKYATSHYLMSFTKGLNHDPATGVTQTPQDFMALRTAIDDGNIDAFTNRVQVPDCGKLGRRPWEAPTAGTAYDLQGPDCQSITMAPAPALGSDELDFEMAEVYELALLRDAPLFGFDGAGSAAVNAAVARLNKLDYAKADFPVRPRKRAAPKTLDAQTAFRGSSPGVEKGPYLSQFMLLGNDDLDGTGTEKDGNIEYGALQISQKVPVAKIKDDYMVKWQDWLKVQNGCNVNSANGTTKGQCFEKGKRRLICTPRDMATYVHFDALYEAYLNATLILLAQGTPFDSSFAHLSGMRPSFSPDDAVDMNAGGFALYGGPHILTLVTEVATRALKAARFQKFNTHIRARPEVLAARLDAVNPKDDAATRAKIEEVFPQICGELSEMCGDLTHTLKEVRACNKDLGADSILLPMAFAEGSPMHPAYAAGHATVAGACVTVMKAFFDTGAQLVKRTKTVVEDATGDITESTKVGFFGALPVTPPAHGCTTTYKDLNVQYFTDKDCKLKHNHPDCPLTLEGELNKLAANISIARNMAGVHYFSDYYDSLRMGEEIAIGMLQEQALCYPTDPFVMSVQTFDGQTVRIGAR